MRLRAFTLSGAGLALALAGCAEDRNEEQEVSPSPLPLVPELALARAVPGEARPAVVVDMSVEQLKVAIAQGDLRLIDVRRDDEVVQGMIAGAEHIPLDRFDPATLDLSDGREVILYCRSGRRSAVAAERLATHIGKPVRHLQGGYRAWAASHTN